MALDYHHPGGQALVNISVASMNAGAPAAAPAHLAHAAPAAPRPMRWGNLLVTLNQLWVQYEVFITTCEDIASPKWVHGDGVMVPRTLEASRHIKVRHAAHRAHYDAVIELVVDARAALLAANDYIRNRAVTPDNAQVVTQVQGLQTGQTWRSLGPPALLPGQGLDLTVMNTTEKLESAKLMVAFRDALLRAGDQVHAYRVTHDRIVARHQQIFNNVISAISVITSVIGAAGPRL